MCVYVLAAACMKQSHSQLLTRKIPLSLITCMNLEVWLTRLMSYNMAQGCTGKLSPVLLFIQASPKLQQPVKQAVSHRGQMLQTHVYDKQSDKMPTLPSRIARRQATHPSSFLCGHTCAKKLWSAARLMVTTFWVRLCSCTGGSQRRRTHKRTAKRQWWNVLDAPDTATTKNAKQNFGYTDPAQPCDVQTRHKYAHPAQPWDANLNKTTHRARLSPKLNFQGHQILGLLRKAAVSCLDFDCRYCTLRFFTCLYFSDLYFHVLFYFHDFNWCFSYYYIFLYFLIFWSVFFLLFVVILKSP